MGCDIPADLEAEEAALGSILIDPQALSDVRQFCTPTDFYSERNAVIFAAMCALADKHTAVDVVTVADELAVRNHLDDIGGDAYLTKLVTSVPTAMHAAEYARIVADKAILRRLIQGASRVVSLAYGGGDTPDIIDQAEQIVFDITRGNRTIRMEDAGSIANRVVDQIDAMAREGVPSGVLTGLTDLDRLLQGLQSGDLVLLAARPSVGKTSLALGIAQHVARCGTVALYSMEMSSEQVMMRLLAQISGINATALRTGMVPDGQWAALTQAQGVVGGMSLYINDTPALTVTDIATHARRLAERKGLDLVVVDYLQLLRSSNKSGNRVQEVAQLSGGLKALARELRVPVLALSQLSRSIEQRANKHPVLSDLRDSGSLEQDADIVMFIHREVESGAGPVKIIVAKHRKGPIGSVRVFFDPTISHWAGLEQQKLEEES